MQNTTDPRVINRMFKKLFSRTNQEPLSIEQLQKQTKVLLIDDDEPTELRMMLRKSGWTVLYMEDLDSLESKKLKESQIICIDIMGVGKCLQVENGMELVKDIKNKYPEKKIILYSSVSQQDIFSDAIDYVDKRIRKQSSLLPFATAVEERAIKTFNLEDALNYAYSKLKGEFPDFCDSQSFKKIATRSVKNGKVDTAKLAKKAGIGLDVASKIAALLSLAL